MSRGSIAFSIALPRAKDHVADGCEDGDEYEHDQYFDRHRYEADEAYESLQQDYHEGENSRDPADD